MSLSGAVLDVTVSGAKEVVGIRVLPLLEQSTARVNVNGVTLERRDNVSLEPGAPAGWTLEPDGTLLAVLRRTPTS